MTLPILRTLRRHKPLGNLHITIYLGTTDSWRQIAFFRHAGFKRLNFTLCHASSPSLESFKQADELTLPWVYYGLLHTDRRTKVSIRQLQAVDPFIDWIVEDNYLVDEDVAASEIQQRVVPFGVQPPMPISLNTVEKLYLEGFPFESNEEFDELRRHIDFCKLEFLELRSCSNVRLLLDYLVDSGKLNKAKFKTF